MIDVFCDPKPVDILPLHEAASKLQEHVQVSH